MLWVDLKFLKMISYRLEGFKEKKPNELYNCRCPICGDSSRNNRKRRGFFYTRSSNLNYSCHNCGASMSFGSFLKWLDVNLHRTYLLEKFNKDDVRKTPEFITPPISHEIIDSNDILSELIPVSDLDVAHPIYQYILNRKIPRDKWDDIYLADKFVKWAKKHVPDKFPNKVVVDHPRLIFPWRDVSGNMTAYSARSTGQVEPKYYTIPLKEDKGFFGLNHVDFSKPIYVLEGAIDSLFLDNCVAVGTSALWKFSSTSDTIYIPDADIRNKEVMKIVRDMIEDNLKVCMLPLDDSAKDINEMIKSGLTKEQVKDLIDKNTFQGLGAELRFGSWCKIPMREFKESKYEYN